MKKTHALIVIGFLLFGSNMALSQRHSGAVANIGLKKYSFGLKDLSGTKMEDFKGNISPFLGVAYSHVLASKFNFTYEFDFSYLKGTYDEKFDSKYMPDLSTFDPDYDEILKGSTATVKSIAMSVRALGHFEIKKGIFISGGLGYDRFLGGRSLPNNISWNQFDNQGNDISFNLGAIVGAGYSTEKFRIDLRHSFGFWNLMGEDYFGKGIKRYEKLNISQTSITFGYYLGKK